MIPPAVEEAIAAEPRPRRGEPAAHAMASGELYVGGRRLINMTSCDYLGLARHPRVLAAAAQALERWGFGTGSTRVLSGTTALHRQLEQRLADWVGCEEAVLHGSCWTANAAVFGALAVLARRGRTTMAVFSDRLNHASIIDGIRAQRTAITDVHLFDHRDLSGLRRQLVAGPGNVTKIVVSDGVFSMEGDAAPLGELVALAERHHALLMVDDSHGTGVMGATGRGTAEAQSVLGHVDVVTGTLGKALGGAIGGFVAGSRALMAALRTTSRPYVFSNNPPPVVAAGALAAIDVLESDPELLRTLRARVDRMRAGAARIGLRTCQGNHPIVPVMLGEDARAHDASRRLADAGVHATALTFPIVPRDEARLRLQVSAAHSEHDVDHVLGALAELRP